MLQPRFILMLTVCMIFSLDVSACSASNDLTGTWQSGRKTESPEDYVTVAQIYNDGKLSVTVVDHASCRGKVDFDSSPYEVDLDCGGGFNPQTKTSGTIRLADNQNSLELRLPPGLQIEGLEELMKFKKLSDSPDYQPSNIPIPQES